jgi:hypothetical protein
MDQGINELIKQMSIASGDEDVVMKKTDVFRQNLFDKLNEQRRMSTTSGGADGASASTVCDMVICADDSNEFPVHKCIMIAACDYFAAMERSGMQETRQTRIEIRGVSALGLKSVIEFIYTGELSLNAGNLADVLRAISHLQVQYGLKLCEEFICEQLDESNCIEMLNLADLFSMQNVKENVNTFILTNFDKCVANEQFKKFSLEQMSSCLQSNRLKLYPVSSYFIKPCILPHPQIYLVTLKFCFHFFLKFNRISLKFFQV